MFGIIEKHGRCKPLTMCKITIPWTILLVCLLVPPSAPTEQKAGVPQIRGIVRKVAIEEKIKPEHLLAMAWVESKFNPKPKPGDNGRSFGLFQIRIKLHGITKQQAEDAEFAALWACEYLKERGYLENARRGIRRYNGGGKKGSRGYKMAQAYLKKVLARAKKETK